MQTPKLAKSILKYLPLMVVMVIAVTVILTAKDPRRKMIDTPVKTTTQLPVEQNNPQLLIFPRAVDSCFSPEIYTSLPAKCRALSGEFIPLPGASSNAFAIPEGKIIVVTPEGK